MSGQGPVHDPSFIPVLIVVLAIAVVLRWRVALTIIAIGLLVLLGFGAMALLHDMHHAVH